MRRDAMCNSSGDQQENSNAFRVSEKVQNGKHRVRKKWLIR